LKLRQLTILLLWLVGYFSYKSPNKQAVRAPRCVSFHLVKLLRGLGIVIIVCLSETNLQLIVSHFIVSPRSSIECHLSLQVIIAGDVQIRCPCDHISLEVIIVGDTQIRFRGI